MIASRALVLKFLSLALLAVPMSAPISAQTIGIVRWTEVVAAHPRMGSFDPSTRRFIDGPSAQLDSTVLDRELATLEEQLARIEAGEVTSRRQFEASLQRSPKKRAEAEAAFWKAREELQREKSAVSARIAATLSKNEFGGRTSIVTLLPEIAHISQEASNAINRVAAARNCSLVLTEPSSDLGDGAPVVNAYARLSRQTNESEMKSSMTNWVSRRDDIALLLSNHVRAFRPALTNAVDLTDDAIRLLRLNQVPQGGSRK